MKTTNLILLLAIALSSAAFGKDKYKSQMTKNIEVVYKAQTAEELQQAVNAFERIGNAEKDKWEPFYYASFGNIMLANKEKDGTKKDGYLDLAKTALDKAVAINSKESEIVALEGFIHMIRVTVDPATRGQQYSMLSMQSFGKALALNPNNPRAMTLMAQMQFGTAQFFKQAPTEACETATKALGLYAEPKDSLSPSWGKGMTEGLLKQCK
jgi:tetratricopeptide (TPR) repeat protein